MTIKEAIESLKNDWYVSLSEQLCVDMDRRDRFLEAVDIAISALRAKQEAEGNESLTSEQLDKCRKENVPVWVETTGYVNNKSGWGLAGTRQTITQDFWPHPLWYSSYMMDWVAYKRKRRGEGETIDKTK